jgi:hypothetical protein
MSDPSEGTSLSKTIVRLSEDVVNKIAAAEVRSVAPNICLT